MPLCERGSLQFKYPELTPFQYASNTPISAIDLDGAEAYFMADGTKVGQIGNDKNVRLLNENIKLEDAQKLIDKANRMLEATFSTPTINKVISEVINIYSEKNSTDIGMTEAELYTRAFLTLIRQAEAGGQRIERKLLTLWIIIFDMVILHLTVIQNILTYYIQVLDIIYHLQQLELINLNMKHG